MTTLIERRFATRAELDAALENRLRQAIASAGPTAIMLSGGTTPMSAYRAVASQIAPRPSGLSVFFSDERYVPPDSVLSNYHQASPLLQALQQAGATVVRVRTELALQNAARDYERGLEGLLASGIRIGLGLLGLGADGHTASLFGRADLARATGRLAIAVQRPDGLSAVSVTPDLLAHVTEPLFAVVTTGKEHAVQRLLARDAQLTAWRAVQGCSAVELWLAG